MDVATRVPFLDLNAAVAECRDEFDADYRRVLDSGWFLLGSETSAFEREFAAACGAEHAIVVSTGLDALVLSLRALGVGPGDEVIVPGFTFIATWLAVSAAGATVVPVDVVDATCNIDAALVEGAITARTRAIMPVHLQGRLADMDALRVIAARHDLLIVEDAAQAHLATGTDGSRAGALGDAAGFSFYPGKNLGALGDGGAVTTNDAALADRVRSLRNYGSVVKYVHDEPGVNSRLDELQCAFLSTRLRRVGAWTERRREIAARYTEALQGCDLQLPSPAGADHVWHVYAVRSARRDELQRDLAERGVDTLIHYPTPPHRTGAYSDLRDVPLPVADAISRETLSLPIGPHMSDDQVEHVITSVRALTGS